MIDKKEIELVLENIKDPEIPVLSIQELGMISQINIDQNPNSINIKFLPTFIGCPAIKLLKSMIHLELSSHFDVKISVDIDYDKAWNSNMITESGKKKLEKFGIAAPEVKSNCTIDMKDLLNVKCPHCQSTNTSLRSPFGSTLCRAMHYCNQCKQGFEQFKPVV